MAAMDAAALDLGKFGGIGDQCPEAIHYETARGIGLGTGLRASAVSTSALAYSPAALALGRVYHVEGVVDYMPGFNTVALGANVVDSSTSKLGAGIGLRGFISGDGGFDGLDGRLGLAFPISDLFAVGMTGRYIDLHTEIEDADGEPVTVELAEGFTLDASLRLVPSPGLQIDVYALNFVDLNSLYVPVVMGTSFAIGASRNMSFGVDVLTDMTSYQDPKVTVGGGAEYLARGVPVRVGYLFDQARKIHAMTAGMGYADPRIGLDISLRQQVSGGDETRIIAAMRYFVR